MKKSFSMSVVMAVVMTVVMMMTAVACSAKYNSIAEYAQASEVQEVAQKASNSTIKCEVVGQGDTLLFKYIYQIDLDEDLIPTLATELEKELAKKTELFTNMKDELKVNVNVANPSVKMAYYTKDGTLITEYEPENY